MFVPERIPDTPQGEICTRCKREPAHEDDIVAWKLGYTWTVCDPGFVTPFWICAACFRIERREVHASNRAYYIDHGANPTEWDAIHPAPV